MIKLLYVTAHFDSYDNKSYRTLQYRKAGNLLMERQSIYPHHEEMINSYNLKINWWRTQTEVDCSRCRICWLRLNQCYCTSILTKRNHYKSMLDDDPAACNVEVIMYYSHQEIGRSANTAHYMQAICPYICNTAIIHGDSVKEIALMDQIEQEFISQSPQTAILFPWYSPCVELLYYINSNTYTLHHSVEIRSCCLNGWQVVPTMQRARWSG